MNRRQPGEVELSSDGDGQKSTAYSVSQNTFCATAKGFVKNRAVVHTTNCDEFHILVSPSTHYVLPSVVERNHRHKFREIQKQPPDAVTVWLLMEG